MTGDYRVWRGSARVMAESVDAAVTAARAGDPVAFGEAMTRKLINEIAAAPEGTELAQGER